MKQIQTRWETIKFTVPEGDKQTDQMTALGADADTHLYHTGTALPEIP